MKRSGVADLYLHPGRAPIWLFKRMKAMADALFQVMVDKYGADECLRRLSDPLWFQALSNVLGFDWDSSGATTVLCGVLHSVLSAQRHGLIGIGGKGARSRQVPIGLQTLSKELDVGGDQCQEWLYASRMTAKVDSAVLQDGYELYHHMIFINPESGHWSVVQQGMDAASRTSRRYHWLSDGLTTYVEEPHSGLFSRSQRKTVLDLTSRKSRSCRNTSVAIVTEETPNQIRRLFFQIKPPPSYQKTTLLRWMSREEKTNNSRLIAYHRVFPQKMAWDAVKRVYDLQPQNFEALIALRGIGANTLRGLALLSEMVYGESPSWVDPVRMTFAFGGKDGVPFPVNRKAYDEAISFLNGAIDEAKLDKKIKIEAFRRLQNCLSHPLAETGFSAGEDSFIG